jgi:hypothetical protein
MSIVALKKEVQPRNERLIPTRVGAWSGMPGPGFQAFQLEQKLVRIAPQPFFARFIGAHDWMLLAVGVPGSVPVLGVVAAPHVATGHTDTKMVPLVPHLETILTTVA